MAYARTPIIKKINIPLKNLGVTLKYRVSGGGISKSDYTRKLEAKSDLFQRKDLLANLKSMKSMFRRR